jgi:hypothetical protein
LWLPLLLLLLQMTRTWTLLQQMAGLCVAACWLMRCMLNCVPATSTTAAADDEEMDTDDGGGGGVRGSVLVDALYANLCACHFHCCCCSAADAEHMDTDGADDC